ncbi:MAG TPA: hypothetical protein VNG12_18625 [Acidimicrobiales bacterium]|nr:hypothetical protein [Acidimicrobiales bacterium]
MTKFDTETFGMSDALLDLIRHALNESLTAAATGAPVLPTVYFSFTATRCTVVSGSEQSMEEIARLGWALAKRKPPYFVMVIEGHLTTESEPRTPALFAEGFEHDRAYGVRSAQRYRLATAVVAFERIGNLSFLGQIHQPREFTAPIA